ncbi:MAG: hypothetical protein IJL55_08580 [Lachnospiraceae bacterium]|nr:hypothetical protein [Lachnospiraceae bacterium]
MKKFLILLCILILILSLPACSKTEPETPTSITDQPSPTTAEPTPAVDYDDLYPGTPVTKAHLLKAEYYGFSQDIYDMIAEDWKQRDAMDEMERMTSSHAPGVCGKSFSTWEGATEFVGVHPWNPLESKEWMKDLKPRQNDGTHQNGETQQIDGTQQTEATQQTDVDQEDSQRLNYSVTFSGTREGELLSLILQSDYYLEHGFVNEMILLYNPNGTHKAWIEDDMVGECVTFSFEVYSGHNKETETVTADILLAHSEYYDAVRLALPKAENYKYFFNITSNNGTEDLAVYFNKVCEYVGIPLDYDGLMQLIGKS